MVDCRTMLSALVAAYDQHRRWMMADRFAALQRAVEHARDVLAQPETASAVEAAIAAGQPVTLPSGTVIADPAWFESLITIRAADLLECQAAAAPVARLPEDAQVIESVNRIILAPIPAPIPVSERLPEPEDCDAEGRCWWGDAGDDQFVPSWRLCEQPDDTHFNHWLPAHALPLPEVK